jgi:CubicO group peptidase (beta-lactamase class C family)
MRLKFLLFFVSLSLFVAAQQRSHQSGRRELIQMIDSILETQVSQNLIPGAVILIKKDSQVVYEQAYGYARKYNRDQQELVPPEKMTTEHLFDIASLTKVVGTTTAIMLLTDNKFP